MENSLYEDSSLVPIVKVIDFGLCAEIKGGETSRAFVGTVLYTAPEVSTTYMVHGIYTICRDPEAGEFGERWHGGYAIKRDVPYVDYECYGATFARLSLVFLHRRSADEDRYFEGERLL